MPVEDDLDDNALFANFAEEPSEEIQMLKKHLKKENKQKPSAVVVEKNNAESEAQKKYIKELEEQNSKLKGKINFEDSGSGLVELSSIFPIPLPGKTWKKYCLFTFVIILCADLKKIRAE